MTSEAIPALFAHPVQVRFADTDLQGHVFFGNYYTYLDEAFMAYLRALGFSWQQLIEMGLEIFYVDSGCQFRRPSYFEDKLQVQIRIAKMGNSSIRAEMAVVREDGTLSATGFITGVVVDAKSGKSVRVPEPFRLAVAMYQGD